MNTGDVTRPERRRWIWMSVIAAVLVLALDQWTKQIAVAKLKTAEPMSWANGLLTIVYAENRGAFLGLGNDWPPHIRWVVLSLAVGVMLIGLAVWVFRNQEVASPEMVLWSMLIAGGVGNLIDRIRNGYVVDFLHMRVGPLQTGVFNIADIAITAAVIILFISAFRTKPKEAES